MLFRSAALFLKNPSLAPQVLSNLVYDYYLLFLPILLFGFFQNEHKIALSYAVVFGLSSLILMSKKAGSFLPLWAAIIGASSVTGLMFDSFYGYAISLSAMLGLTIRDAQQSVFHARMSDLSSSPQVFSIMTILGMILIPVFTMSFNILLSFLTEGSQQIALFSQVGLALILMILLIKEPRLSRASSSEMTSIPQGVRTICRYSLFYNATSFPIRMIVGPLIIYKAILETGYSQQAISITGAIIGLIAVLGILLRFLLPSSSINNRIMMVRYHHIGIVSMILIFFLALGMQYNWWPEGSLSGMVLLIILLQLALEVTGKLWSLGFIGTLREMTLHSNGSSRTYQSSYLYFMSMKNLGSCVGFVLASGSYYFVSAPATVVLTGVMGILYVIMTINTISEQAPSRPASTPLLVNANQTS